MLNYIVEFDILHAAKSFSSFSVVIVVQRFQRKCLSDEFNIIRLTFVCAVPIP